MRHLPLILVLPSIIFAGNSTLFRLKRSTNSNEILYELKHDSCIPRQKDPIHPYWIMNTKGGVQEELTGIERRRAYGVNIKSVNKTEVVFTLKAVPERTIKALCISEKPTAQLKLNGKPSVLESVFVNTKGGGLIPKVESIVLKGYDLSSYERVEERLVK